MGKGQIIFKRSSKAMNKSKRFHNPINDLNKTIIRARKNNIRPSHTIPSITDDETVVTSLHRGPSCDLCLSVVTPVCGPLP